jgi:Zn-dependent protease
MGSLDAGKVLDFVNFMAVLIFSTACHEFAHAGLADRFGDPTPRAHGRISFNPFVHVDPFFTVLLPAVLYWTGAGFMAAAWTPVDPSRMRKPHVHGLLTALAGPATNVVLAAFFFAVVAVHVLVIGGITPDTGDRHRDFAGVLVMAVRMNLFLAIFNFLPVPPLDGSNLVAFLLPPRLRARWEGLRRHAWILFAVLLMTGALEPILGPPMRAANALVGEGIAAVNSLAAR